MRHINFTDTLDPASLERRAYMAGDTLTAERMARIAELERELAEAEGRLESLPTEEEYSDLQVVLDKHEQFFRECFRHLGGYGPAPTIDDGAARLAILEAIKEGSRS